MTTSFPEIRPRTIRRQSRIAATASVFPDRVVTNQEIIEANHLPVSDVAVRKTLGMAKRRVVEPGVTDSDLLVRAARLCLERAQVDVDRLSKILVTKFVGDRVLPMTASLVQRKLNARVAMHAVDIEGGISSFLHAVDLATRYVSTTDERGQYVLILSGGIHNLPVSKADPRMAFLFGDGAAALLIADSDEPHFLAFYGYTDYRYYDAAGTEPFTMNPEISERIYGQGEHDLLSDLYRMGNWKVSLDFYLRAAQVTWDRLLQESGLKRADIDWVLVTENNKRIRDLTLGALGIPEEQSLTVVQEYGNTMSASLPILLDKAYREHRLRDGMNVMMISHGEGASGGGFIYRV